MSQEGKLRGSLTAPQRRLLLALYRYEAPDLEALKQAPKLYAKGLVIWYPFSGLGLTPKGVDLATKEAAK